MKKVQFLASSYFDALFVASPQLSFKVFNEAFNH